MTVRMIIVAVLNSFFVIGLVQSVIAEESGFFVRIDENGRPIAERLPAQTKDGETLKQSEVSSDSKGSEQPKQHSFDGEDYEDADEILKKPKRKRFYTYINELGQLVSVEE